MSNLLTDISDGIGTLLNAPEARNTMTMPMVEEICAAMDEFEADEGCSAVIVTGAGSAFCAGADLGIFRLQPRRASEPFTRASCGLLDRRCQQLLP